MRIKRNAEVPSSQKKNLIKKKYDYANDFAKHFFGKEGGTFSGCLRTNLPQVSDGSQNHALHNNISIDQYIAYLCNLREAYGHPVYAPYFAIHEEIALQLLS
ncbi:MAG: hypothetical protein GWP06_10330 [Actinobacteria bacterium]|nr:hypothetical protein [Actinomycetota bacterium]